MLPLEKFLLPKRSPSVIEIAGQFFDTEIQYFGFSFELPDTNELRVFREFKNLKTVSFSDTNLDDIGLGYICENEGIENLCLQDTKITNEGLRFLSKLPSLEILRLKDNIQFTDDCVPQLNALKALRDLQIHETSITHLGLKYLNLPLLEDLLVGIDEDNFSFEFLRKLSIRLPRCTILAKGNGEFYQGRANIF